jgi:hypothetical protein
MEDGFQMNVSDATLFPGLEGIGRSIAMLLASRHARMNPTGQINSERVNFEFNIE